MKRFFKIFCVAIVASFVFNACQKNIEGDSTIIDPVLPPAASDITTKVTAVLVSGFVTDGNDVAVKDASVEVGTKTMLTDKYGYFEIRNVQVVQNAAMVDRKSVV